MGTYHELTVNIGYKNYEKSKKNINDFFWKKNNFKYILKNNLNRFKEASTKHQS
jgi:hypothetical protein